MLKILIYVSLISYYWPQVLASVLSEPESLNRPLNASNYLSLLSRIRTTESSLTSSSNENQISELKENVRQLRVYLNSMYETPSFDCQNSVFEFGIILSKFVECLIVNEMPFSLCLSCSQQYTDLIKSYFDLNNSSISNCSDSVLSGDKLDLVRDFYSSSLSKWKDGDCDSKSFSKAFFEILLKVFVILIDCNSNLRLFWR